MEPCFYSPEALLTSIPVFPLSFPPVDAIFDESAGEIPASAFSDYRILEHLRGLPLPGKRGRMQRNVRSTLPPPIAELLTRLGVSEDKLQKANVILYYGNVEILESIREEQLGIESAYREVSMQFSIALPSRRDA